MRISTNPLISTNKTSVFADVKVAKQKDKDNISYVESALRRKYFDTNNYNYRDMLEDVEEDNLEKKHREDVCFFSKS